MKLQSPPSFNLFFSAAPSSSTTAGGSLAPHTETSSPILQTETFTPGRFESQIPNYQTYNNARRGGTKVGAYLQKNPKALDAYPASFRKLASSLSDAQFKVLHGGTKGSTFGVSHRKAFIKGKVGFKSIWGNVHDQMTDARKKYNMINSQEEKQLHKMVDQVKAFTPKQRESLVNLLDRAAR